MYNAKIYKNNTFKKTVPVISFISILLVSFLLSGSAKLNQNSELSLNDSPLKQIRISYKFNSVAIGDILRKISLDYGVKIHSAVEIEGRASANLISSPLHEALAVILKDSAYEYKLEKDAIIIEKRRSEAFLAVSDRMGLKRVLIAPAFISGAEVKRIVDSLKTTEAIVNYDEKSGVLVLDEKPDAAERIINEINRLDVADAQIIKDGSNAQTKLFILKNINLKDVFGDIEKMLSSGGTAFANYELNSLIVTDKNEVIVEINRYIAKLETDNGVPVIDCKFYKVPRAVINDLIGLGYYDAREIDLAELSFSIVKNKIHYLSILDKYLRYSSKMSCDSSDNAEMKVLHKSISSKIAIKPYINIDAGYSLKISLQEDAQAFNETLRFKSQNYNFDINENDIVIAKGFEKSFIDVINQNSFRRFLSYMPAVANINAQLNYLAAENATADGEENGGGSGGGEEEFILMAIELSTVKNNTGMAKYSFVNLLHLDSQNAYADYTAGGNGPFSDNKSYLNIFAAPAGAENYSKSVENSKEYGGKNGRDSSAKPADKQSPFSAADKTKNAIFKIKAKSGSDDNIAGSGGNGGVKNLIIEDHRKNSSLALKISYKADNDGPAIAAGHLSENETLVEIKNLIAAGKYDQAKNTALKHLAAEEGSCRVRVALGSIYKEMKQYISAHRELKAALKYDAGNKKLNDNIEKLENLIALIKDEKNKLAGREEAEELEMYLR